ncbi:Crp/Fnr family transcriptional regulator [Crocosphaera sp. XPORK-15E]|uniref:Crp/Fnr family transcriptional regulator n=1 Tax=Crocosphaera sp. XPORK-15E TaxID=3110247 RepID=UPI002B206FDE|nr:Crp/Fnr family transcriptional regulator [Crocosphaera sp. XPORK-15E]MEA5536485.1 Crp/Fnr family transcriptional regulator [Crocosphaera sp. XPORK-15E]
MSQTKSKSGNQLIDALPLQESRRLTPYFKLMYLDSGTILHEPGEILEFAYFPIGAMISLVSIMDNGATTEMGLIGNEGFVGLPIILGGEQTISRGIVQMDGESLKINGSILKKEFQRGLELQALLLIYTQARLTQVAQTSACNRQHSIRQRLARWLLSVYDCVLEDELPLTQEFMANMLGTRRAGVTNAANELQNAGLISYSRGKVHILDRKGLEENACECYRVIQNEYIRLLGSKRG